MDERLRFVARLLEGDKMAVLCRELGISRMTGYKLYQRYRDIGLEGLTDRSRRPYRQANKLPFQVERATLGFMKAFPSSGLVMTAAGCQPEDRGDLGVDFSSTSAILVCQPGPVAFQLAITSGGNRSDRSLRGCCNFGRPRRTSFSPRYRSAPAIHSSEISGGSLVTTEVRTEPFRFALMTMPHADDAPGRTARCPDEHNQP
jgi:hypothetical protein